jgi:multidrug efflux pump subunit AcrA (membrane-fusion protein)
MTPRKLQVAFAALLLLAIGGWWIAARRSPVTSGEASAADMPGMSGMTSKSSRPDSQSLTLTADEIRSFGVTFGTVEERALEPTVRATGLVVLDETRVAQVTSKVGGFVERLEADYSGQQVRRGQALYALYSPELVSAQEELLAAARLPGATGGTAVPGLPSGAADLLEAARRRLDLWGVSQGQIDAVLRRGAPQRAITFLSPLTGVVVEKQVVLGQAIESGQPLYTIADLSEVWVNAHLRESDAGAVAEGSRAEVEFAAFPGRPVTGQVSFVAPTLQGASRSVQARIAVPNPGGKLRPGMYGTVRISAPGWRALTVPSAAVVRTGERSIVFVDLGSGRLSAREVKTGRTAAGLAEVLAGLEPGQRVVTSAQFLLESESNLSEIMRSMMGQSGAGGMDGMDPGGAGGGHPAGHGEDKGADMRGVPGITMPGERR